MTEFVGRRLVHLSSSRWPTGDVNAEVIGGASTSYLKHWERDTQPVIAGDNDSVKLTTVFDDVKFHGGGRTVQL